MGQEKKGITIPGLPDPKLTQLKKKHGQLTYVKVDGKDGGDDLHFLFKKPDMFTLSAAAKVGDGDPMRATQIYFSNCLVYGDASAVDDVDIFMSVAPELNALVETRQVEVKKI